MTREEWAKEVRKALVDRDESASQMADHLGLSRQWVSKVLLGDNPGTETVAQINKYLGLEVDHVDTAI